MALLCSRTQPCLWSQRPQTCSSTCQPRPLHPSPTGCFGMQILRAASPPLLPSCSIRLLGDEKGSGGLAQGLGPASWEPLFPDPVTAVTPPAMARRGPPRSCPGPGAAFRQAASPCTCSRATTRCPRPRKNRCRCQGKAGLKDSLATIQSCSMTTRCPSAHTACLSTFHVACTGREYWQRSSPGCPPPRQVLHGTDHFHCGICRTTGQARAAGAACLWPPHPLQSAS